MKKYAEWFYKSTEWERCRDNYVRSVGGLCENCMKNGAYTEGVIVHHIEHITPKNIHNPEITLNHDNLMLLCRECHGQIHRKISGRRYKVDKWGRVIISESPPVN